jgi:acetyl esterase
MSEAKNSSASQSTTLEKAALPSAPPGAPTTLLDPDVATFAARLAAQGGPPLNTLSPNEARAVLTRVQSGNVALLPADVEERTIPGGPTGTVSVRIVRPSGTSGALPAVMYFHGGGWILGDAQTHDRLVREIANGATAAVVFVNYTRSPEAHYPVAIEQAYAATKWVAENGSSAGLDTSRLVVAGDSVGGNMATVVALLAKQRGGPKLAAQLLFYPVTNADFDTPSYRQFAEGPWLTREGMKWFWNAYTPDARVRDEPTASPLRATLEQLAGLPPALVITDENDVLRDEGEAYAHRLMAAGVKVAALRCLGTIHDFMMLNPIAQTPPTRAAIIQTVATLRELLRR